MGRIVRMAAAVMLLLCFAVPVRGLEPESPFWSGKRVMVLVPHQDDELNLAGGILEQYVQAGSQVWLVYATNGDYNGLAQIRSREVLAMAAELGIPAENVIYLGYGNQWQPQGEQTHLYFSDDGDTLWTSHFGATETYGTDAVGVWRESTYTRDHFLADLTDVILTLRPDVIYCNDYDAHHDHMALDLFFEEAMGRILAAEPDYRPRVYKGFCYGTAWYAPADFAGAENIRSSLHPVWEHWDRLGIGYDWESRVRLPLSGANLSRMLSQTQLYRSVRLFQSQNGHRFAESILNGDKVFFERRTDSLLYRAELTAGGQIVTVWNDFKLKDSRNFSALVNTGVHFAETITVTLPEPQVMDSLWLYDNPEPEDNILAGYLEFEDGTQVAFRPLNPGGAATKIAFPARSVGRFRLHLTETEGDTPGLTEIEAYLGDGSGEARILMAVDEQGDFVYDYWMPRSGTAVFDLYAYPAGSLSGWADADIAMEGDAVWSLEAGKLRIRCPTGAQAAFTVTGPGGVSTTFTVSNPPALIRKLTLLLQKNDRDMVLAIDEWLCRS